MTTFITFRSKKDKTPHYCDKKYGEAVSDRFYYMRDLHILRRLPFWSLARGFMNSFWLPKDDVFLCNGLAELYPVYYRHPTAKVVTLAKEKTFFDLPEMSSAKRAFLIDRLSIASGLITDTNAMKKTIKKHTGIRTEVCNPFCAQPFLENRAKLGTQNILFIGAYSPNKGYLNLVEAFEILRRSDSGWNLYMLGSCIERIRETMKGMNLLGYVPDLKPYFSACSIYVHPAYFEPFGISVLEAMSAGLIPIVTKKTGVSEVLEEHGLAGLVVKDNDPETLAEKISAVRDYSLRKKKHISDKCKNIIRDGYLEQDGVKNFKEAFYRLLDG